MLKLPKKLPALVFAVAAIIGLLLPVAAYRAGSQTNHLRFERLADEAVERIVMRINQHISLLTATRSLFEARRGNVSREEFAAFVSHLNIKEEFDGVQGIGYAAVLEPGSEALVRESLARDYGVDRAPFPQSTEDMRTAIMMLEPPDERNLADLGFDMYSQVTRRAAMRAAQMTHERQASGMVELLQEIDDDKRRGFLVYLPYFAHNSRPGQEGGAATPGAPGEQLRGFIFASFRAGDLINAALSHGQTLPVHLKIHDGKPEDGRLLFESDGVSGATAARADGVQRSVVIAGHEWSVTATPTEGFQKGPEEGVALLLGVCALLMAGALAVSIRSQLRALEASREVLRVTESAAAQKDFLLQEMKHRIKNSIARVLAIARQTAAHSSDLEEFTHSFTNRLQAMATSQDLLTHAHHGKANLSDLLHGELRQVFGETFTGLNCTGPDQELGMRTTQALALVFHELATNALKYANLDEGGGIDVRWRSGADGRSLVIDWRERGSADPDAAQGTGFGTKLIRSLIEGELSGALERNMTDEGLQMRLTIPQPAT